jgi:hypothetical protein
MLKPERATELMRRLREATTWSHTTGAVAAPARGEKY